MGYSTDFMGEVEIKPQPTEKIKNFVNELARTRRMKRRLPEGLYGVEGEFCVTGGENHIGDGKDDTVMDHNSPPSTQPGLWLQWIIEEAGHDGNYVLRWDQGEKFYEYIEWMEYLIYKIFAPNGYVLNGEIDWRGEEFYDTGRISVKNNKVTWRER